MVKIRNKINRVFIVSTALILCVAFLLIYFFSKRYTERDFFRRLNQRSLIAAQTFLAEDELSANIYNEIRQTHLQILPGEKERIYELDSFRNTRIPAVDSISPNFKDILLRQGTVQMIYNRRYFTGLLYRDNSGDFVVILSALNQDGERELKNLRTVLLVTFFVSLLLLFYISRYYSSQLLDPIIDIIRNVNKIRVTNMHLRLDPGKNQDELSELASTFNNMLDRLEASFELQVNFINNASHELRNPLTAIMGQAEIALSRERTPDEYQETLRSIENESQRLDILVSNLLKLAQVGFKKDALLIEKVRIDELIMDIKENFNRTNPENQISLDFSHIPLDPYYLAVEGNSSLLHTAFNNVIDNACKFSDNREVIIELFSEDDQISVIVRDQGVGIPASELHNIYEPFYRGSNVKQIKGYGFGLPLVYHIIHMHKGSIHVQSLEDQGTTVTITLPSGKNRFFNIQ